MKTKEFHIDYTGTGAAVTKHLVTMDAQEQWTGSISVGSTVDGKLYMAERFRDGSQNDVNTKFILYYLDTSNPHLAVKAIGTGGGDIITLPTDPVYDGVVAASKKADSLASIEWSLKKPALFTIFFVSDAVVSGAQSLYIKWAIQE